MKVPRSAFVLFFLCATAQSAPVDESVTIKGIIDITKLERPADAEVLVGEQRLDAQHGGSGDVVTLELARGLVL